MSGLRVGIVGTGLAGALLAWRLVTREDVRVLLMGAGQATDATAVSGGLVRGFETDPALAESAAAGMAELLADERLRDWAGYREIGSVYLLPGADLYDAQLDPVQALVPGSARVLERGEVERGYPFRGLPEGTVGVVERRAGYVSPARLRGTLLDRLATLGVPASQAPVRAVTDGPACHLADGRRVDVDVLVLAAGRWTGTLLRDSGLPVGRLRTKLIQCAEYRCAGPTVPSFVDETTGLYGRSTTPGRVLLGLPTERWDQPPDALSPDTALAARVPEVAADRLPGLRLSTVERSIVAADAYHAPPGLALREVDGARGIHTFTGGSGGAVKTALACSRTAAEQVIGRGSIPAPAAIRCGRGDA